MDKHRENWAGEGKELPSVVIVPKMSATTKTEATSQELNPGLPDG